MYYPLISQEDLFSNSGYYRIGQDKSGYLLGANSQMGDCEDSRSRDTLVGATSQHKPDTKLAPTWLIES